MSSEARSAEPAEDKAPLEDRVRLFGSAFRHAYPPQFAELEASGLVDVPTFNQILEMDDDDDDIFSKQIVLDFFEQAEQTFEKMDAKLCVFQLRRKAIANIGQREEGPP
jgi:hypothetical protein